MNGRRAVLLTTDYPPGLGGIARLLGELVASTADSVDWTVLGPGETPAGKASLRLAIDPARLATAARWLRRARGRLVVCGHPYLSTVALALARASGASVGAIVYGRELAPRRFAHRAALRGLRHADRVVAISGYSADRADRLGVPAARLRVVAPLFRPPWAGRYPPRPRSPGSPLRLAMITRLEEGYKNVELVLRALQVLGPAGVVERATIIGGGSRVDAVRGRAAAIGVGRYLDLPGAVSDAELGERAAGAHVGVFPSRDSAGERGFEGFGLAVAELAAAGLPVLVARAGGAVDAARGEFAMLLDPDDLRAWVDALAALAADEDRRGAMATAACAWANALDSTATAHRMMDALGAP